MTGVKPGDSPLAVHIRSELRLALEELRIQRARATERIPTLRSLIEEALDAFLASKKKSNQGPRTRTGR